MNPRIVVIGLGMHGAGIARAALEQGGQVVGAADPRLEGRPLGEVLGHSAALDGLTVAAEGASMVSEVEADLAIIAAPVELDELRDMVLACFDAGLDVLTIHEEVFDPPVAWAAEVDERARAAGRSMLATGVQDVWWVHVPAVAAAATTSLTRIRASHAIDIEQVPVPVGRMFGVGLDPSEFAGVRDEFIAPGSAILGAPMRVLARRLGLTPGEASRVIEPAVAATPVRWRAADEEIAAGRVTGYTERVSFPTAEGVAFESMFEFRLTSPDDPYDEIVLEGDPVLTLQHRPFPGDRITDVVPVSRIPDVLDAPPGLLSAGDLPPARYRHVQAPNGAPR